MKLGKDGINKQLNHSKVENAYKYYVVSSLQEQKEILNSRHPLIGLGIKPDKKMDMLRGSSLLKLIESDPAIDVSTHASRKGFTLKIYRK